MKRASSILDVRYEHPEPTSSGRPAPWGARSGPALLLLAAALAACHCNQQAPDPQPPAPGPVRVVGLVVDGADSPVAGATVQLGDWSSVADAQGAYALAVAPEAPRALRVTADGFAAAERAVDPTAPTGRVYVPPIRLSRLSAEGTLDGQGGTVGDLAAGVVVSVPAGAFGRAVKVTAALVTLGDPLLDDDRLPAPVPTAPGVFVAPLFGLILDAEGEQPAAPLSVSVAVAAKLPAQTRVPVGRFDSEQGRWIEAGVATFAADGALHFEVSHLSTYAGALPAVPRDPSNPPDLDALGQVPSPFLPGEPRVDPKSGGLQVGVPLPALVRGNRRVQLTLFHDSRTVQGVLPVAAAARDAKPQEELLVKLDTPVGTRRLEATVDSAVSAGLPAAVQCDVAPAASDEPLTSGSYAVTTTMLRAESGELLASGSEKFTAPSRGAPLDHGGPVAAPAKVGLGRSVTRQVAVHDRSQSPFGAGWHLEGLTWLSQPWCARLPPTLLGGVEQPAVTFGASGERYLSRLEDVLLAAGVSSTSLSGAPQVALGDQVAYVAVPVTGAYEVWRIDLAQRTAVRFAGGGADTSGSGPANQLRLGQLSGMSLDRSGAGLVLGTADWVSRISAEGQATRLFGLPAGSPAGKAPAEGVALSALMLEGQLGAFTAGSDDQTWFLSTNAGKHYWVSQGVLHVARLSLTPGHPPVVAFSPEGAPVYVLQGANCVYRYVDGLSDEVLFPTCRQGVPSQLVDGPVASATVGTVGALAYDEAGALWFLDQTFHALRTLSADGVVATVAGNHGAAVSGVGGPVTQAGLGLPWSFGRSPLGDVMVGSTGAVLWLAPLPEDQLQGLAAGDGSVLRKLPDGTWQRLKADGAVELYDARGLLQSRGRAGETPLSYVWEAWASPPEDAAPCGRPYAMPRLSRIELGGETLFTFEWQSGNLVAVVDAAGRRTTAEWQASRLASVQGPSGPLGIFRYDDGGRVAERDMPGPSGEQLTWRYGYEQGRLASVEVPGRGLRTWTSAERSVISAPADLSSTGVSRSAVARPMISQVPTATGAQAQVQVGSGELVLRSPAGDGTRLELDGLGRVSRVVEPDGTELSLVRDAVGRVVEVSNQQTQEAWRYAYHAKSGALVERTDPAGRTTLFDRDAQGRVSARRDPDQGTWTFEYQETGPAAHQPTRVRDPLGRAFDLTYDARGNLASHLAPGGLLTRVDRDDVGRPVKVTEPGGLVHATEYDLMDGVTRQVLGDPKDGNQITYQRRLAYGWEAVGSHVPASVLLSATDGEGHAWSFVRDAAFMPKDLTTPADGTTHQAFDAQGRRASRTLADGSREDFTWDGVTGRLARRAFGAGSFLDLRYDGLGRVSKLTDPASSEARAFVTGTGWSQVDVRREGTVLPAAFEFQLSRARFGYGVERQTVGATALTVSREWDGQLSKVELDQGATHLELVRAQYDLSRKLLLLTRANGVNTARTYDVAGRVATQSEQGPGGTVTFAWTYDAAGRPETRTVGGVTRTYAYDAAGHLAGCSDTGQSWAYDRSGRRSTSGGKAWTRDALGHLTDDGVYQYTYDVLGRRTSKVAAANPTDRLEYVWGADGLLAEVRRGPSGSTTLVAQLRWDGSGRQVQRAVAAGSWLFGYAPDSDRPVRVVEPQGRAWHLAHDERTAVYRVAVAATGERRFTHVDPFGRVLGVSDQTGALTVLPEDCLGQRLASVSQTGPTVGLHGQAYDDTTGLYFAGPRPYDPVTGEFLSPDPIGLEGGVDPYGYGGGNPVVAADPSGRFFFVLVGAVMAGAVIANEIRGFAQSAEVKRTRESYEAMTNNDSDDQLERAEQAHQNLHRAADKGGDVANKCVQKAFDASLNPAESASDLVDGAQELYGSVSGQDP